MTKIDEFLARTHCAGWQRKPITGDASARRYERLTGPNGSAILMIAPPTDTAGFDSFLQIAQVLRDAELAAPAIYDAERAAGLMLIEDLGSHDFARWISAHPADETRLYSCAIDVLARIALIPAPPGLTRLVPDHGARMTSLVWEWYAPDVAPDEQDVITQGLNDILTSYAGVADTLALRDFHAENLIWRPDRKGLDHVGLLDFQDAVIAHRAYDLVSLLRDVRRDVPGSLREAMLDRFANSAAIDRQELDASCAVLGVQRNLRILGVFARLAKRDGKPRYLDFVPRLRHMIAQDLDHPALHPIADPLRRALSLPQVET